MTTPSSTGVPKLEGPPKSLPHISLVPWQLDLWRVQDGASLKFSRHSRPRHRFDSPHGEYGILYTSDDPLGALGESYGERGRRLDEKDGDRQLVRFSLAKPVQLVDLTDVRVLSRLGLDDRINTTAEYDVCQSWALTFYQQVADAHGICYGARKGGRDTLNVALFHRSEALLSVAFAQQLRDSEKIVLAAADQYNLTVSFLA